MVLDAERRPEFRSFKAGIERDVCGSELGGQRRQEMLTRNDSTVAERIEVL